MSDVRIVLKDVIRNRGFNQSAIARKANMKPQTLCDILQLRRRLEASEMFALCDAMEIDYSELRPRN